MAIRPFAAKLNVQACIREISPSSESQRRVVQQQAGQSRIYDVGTGPRLRTGVMALWLSFRAEQHLLLVDQIKHCRIVSSPGDGFSWEGLLDGSNVVARQFQFGSLNVFFQSLQAAGAGNGDYAGLAE